MMNDWYQCMVDTLQLNGKGERTQQAYTRSVRMLSQFYGKTPDLVSEQELQDYFLHRKNLSHWSPKTMRICYCGIRFFYEKVLHRNWHILGILQTPFLDAASESFAVVRIGGHSINQKTNL